MTGVVMTLSKGGWPTKSSKSYSKRTCVVSHNTLISGWINGSYINTSIIIHIVTKNYRIQALRSVQRQKMVSNSHTFHNDQSLQALQGPDSHFFLTAQPRRHIAVPLVRTSHFDGKFFPLCRECRECLERCLGGFFFFQTHPDPSVVA